MASRKRPRPRSAARSPAAGRSRAGLVVGGLVLAIVTVVVVLTVVLTGGGQKKSGRVAFDLPRLDGPGRVALADFAGRPTVVNFFASWCVECRAESPGFARVAQANKGSVALWV